MQSRLVKAKEKEEDGREGSCSGVGSSGFALIVTVATSHLLCLLKSNAIMPPSLRSEQWSQQERFEKPRDHFSPTQGC